MIGISKIIQKKHYQLVLYTNCFNVMPNVMPKSTQKNNFEASIISINTPSFNNQ